MAAASSRSARARSGRLRRRSAGTPTRRPPGADGIGLPAASSAESEAGASPEEHAEPVLARAPRGLERRQLGRGDRDERPRALHVEVAREPSAELRLGEAQGLALRREVPLHRAALGLEAAELDVAPRDLAHEQECERAPVVHARREVCVAGLEPAARPAEDVELPRGVERGEDAVARGRASTRFAPRLGAEVERGPEERERRAPERLRLAHARVRHAELQVLLHAALHERLELGVAEAEPPGVERRLARARTRVRSAPRGGGREGRGLEVRTDRAAGEAERDQAGRSSRQRGSRLASQSRDRAGPRPKGAAHAPAGFDPPGAAAVYGAGARFA